MSWDEPELEDWQVRLLVFHGWREDSWLGLWSHPSKYGFWSNPWEQLLKQHPEIARVYLPELEKQR